MASVRPYKLTPTIAIDMNLVTSLDLIENPNKAGKWQIIISMYYSEPFVLDFDNKLQATTRFAELFQDWHEPTTVSNEDLNKIKEAVDRLAEKVDMLNQLSHTHAYSGTLTSTNPNELCYEPMPLHFDPMEKVVHDEIKHDYAFNVNDRVILASNINYITTTEDDTKFLLDIKALSGGKCIKDVKDFAEQLYRYLTIEIDIIKIPVSKSARELMVKTMGGK